MSFKYLQKTILLLPIFIFAFAFLLPQGVSAAAFGGLTVQTRIQYPNGAIYNLDGVVVTVNSGSGADYRGRCDSTVMGNRSCAAAGIVDTAPSPDTCMSSISATTSGGQVSWSGRFSSCNCSFLVDLSAPAAPSGYVYDGGWDPAEPYRTSAWGNDNSPTLLFTVKVKSATPPSYIITPSADSGCNIAPNSAQTITSGGAVSFWASNNTGYTLNGFSIDGGVAMPGESYQFTNVTSDHTVRAKCSQNTYSVTYDRNGSTSGTVPVDRTAYIYNSNVTVAGNLGNLAKADSIFSGWNTQADGNGTNRAVNSTFTMGTTNIILYAKWTAMTLTCAVVPEAGPSPLVVRVLTSTNIPSPDLTYNFGDGTPNVKSGTSTYHTYETVGTYSITVWDPIFKGGAAQPCTPPTVYVSSPSNNETGEVAP